LQTLENLSLASANIDMDFDDDDFLAGLAPPAAAAQTAGRLEGTTSQKPLHAYQHPADDIPLAELLVNACSGFKQPSKA
jgi:hypothetical protein